jgi:hypothetical protein
MINLGEILTDGSKILIHNSAKNVEGSGSELSAKYGSYGLELSHNNKKELTMYSTAVHEGATLNMYGPGSEITVHGTDYGTSSSG